MGQPTLAITGHRARIELRRPEKRNRIEPADLIALHEIFETIDGDDSIRSVVLTAGGPVFCAGYHLGALGNDNPSNSDEGEDDAPPPQDQVDFGRACDRLERLRPPTICALNGSVHGGGTDLALACDFRIGVEGSVAAMPAARIGLQYYASGLGRYVTRLGPGPTKRMFLTAQPVPAEELVRLGYLDEVVAPEELEAKVDELASAIEALAPLAIANTKRAINDIASGDPDWSAIEEGAMATMRSHDHREGIRALQEKRPPEFLGR
jgi:enoyl-CoA hydratase/carnithine racemase